MILYTGIMLSFAVASAKNSKSKIKLFLSGGLLGILMGFKAMSIGNDTENYVYFFNQMKKSPSFFDSLSRFEKGYQVYNKLIGLVFDDPQALFIVTAIICIGCICYGTVKLSINWQYTLFLFVGLRFFYFFLSGLRQSLALSIVILAFVMLQEKKYIHFLCLVLLSSTFHFSALIFLIVFPLSRIKINGRTVIKILILVLIVYVLFIPILGVVLSKLPSYYSHYIASEAGSANNIANYIYTLINIIFFVFAYLAGNAKDLRVNTEKKEAYDVNLQLLLMLLTVGASFIATRASILDRIVQYFWIFSIFSIPNMLFSIKDQKKRTIWYLLITSFVILYNLVLLELRPEWTEIVPYRFFWQNQ